MVKLLSGRLLVTLDEGKENVGVIFRHECQGDRSLMIPREVVDVPVGAESPPVAPEQYYNHIIFVKEMSDEVDVDGVTYIGMNREAIIALITD